MAPHPNVPPTVEIDRRLGRRLARRRRELGLTEAELEATSGLSAGSVGCFEKGQGAVGAAELLALGRALGVAVGYFFDDPPTAGRRKKGPPGVAGAPDDVAGIMTFLDSYFRIADAKVRSDILGLLKAAAGE